jgi:hypothetical protein
MAEAVASCEAIEARRPSQHQDQGERLRMAVSNGPQAGKEGTEPHLPRQLLVRRDVEFVEEFLGHSPKQLGAVVNVSVESLGREAHFGPDGPHGQAIRADTVGHPKRGGQDVAT